MEAEVKRATIEDLEAQATFEAVVGGLSFKMLRWNALLAIEALGVDRVLGVVDAMQKVADGESVPRDMKAERDAMISCLAVAMIDPPMPEDAAKRRALSRYIPELWTQLMRSGGDAAFASGPVETTGPS